MKSISSRKTFKQKNRFGQGLANLFHVAGPSLTKRERAEQKRLQKEASRAVSSRWGVSYGPSLEGSPTGRMADPFHVVCSDTIQERFRSLSEALWRMRSASRELSAGLQLSRLRMPQIGNLINGVRMPSTVMRESFPEIYSRMRSDRFAIFDGISAIDTSRTTTTSSSIAGFLRGPASEYLSLLLQRRDLGIPEYLVGDAFDRSRVEWVDRHFDELMYSPLHYVASLVQSRTDYSTLVTALRSLSSAHDAAVRSLILHGWVSPDAPVGDRLLTSVGNMLGG